MSGSWTALRLCAAAVAAASVVSAAPADAAPCQKQPQDADTLEVSVEPGAAIRGDDLVVAITVTRRMVGDTPAAAVADASVSMRLRTSRGPIFAGTRTDGRGQAIAVVPIGLDTPSGDAVLATEVWAERAHGVWCVPSVRERGYDETAVQVSERG